MRRTNLDRLVETLEALRHVAETATDTQATRQDPEQAAWLAGYRQATTDALDAHRLHLEAYPTERTAS